MKGISKEAGNFAMRSMKNCQLQLLSETWNMAMSNIENFFVPISVAFGKIAGKCFVEVVSKNCFLIYEEI